MMYTFYKAPVEILSFIIIALLFSSCETSSEFWKFDKESCEKMDAFTTCRTELVWNLRLQKCLCDCGEPGPYEKWYGSSCHYSVADCKGEILPNENYRFFECNCSSVVCPKGRIARAPHCECKDPFGLTYGPSHSAAVDYFPLVQGSSWLFDVLDSVGAKSAEFEMIVVDTLTLGDTSLVHMFFGVSDSTGTIADTVAGPMIYHDLENPDLTRYVSNDNPGFLHSYPDDDTLFIDDDTLLLERIGTVTVPAGTFDDCIYLTSPFDNTSGQVVAPNVGLIKIIDEGDDAVILANYTLNCALIAKVDRVHINCPGDSSGSINITVTGNDEDVSYIWEGPTAIGDTGDAQNLTAGVYRVMISDNLCSITIQEIEITEPDTLSVEACKLQNVMCHGESNGRIELCQGKGGTSPHEYRWNTGNTGNMIEDLSAGQYDVTMTDAFGCQKIFNFSITEPDPLVLTLSSTPSSPGQSRGSVDVEVMGGTPGYSYLWDDPKMSTTSSVDSLMPGIYTVIVTDTNGCSIMDSVRVQFTTPTFDTEDNYMLFLYPNPVHNTLIICSIGETTSINQLSVINSDGLISDISNQVSMHGNNWSVDISDLPEGAYFLRIRFDEMGMKLLQFVK